MYSTWCLLARRRDCALHNDALAHPAGRCTSTWNTGHGTQNYAAGRSPAIRYDIMHYTATTNSTLANQYGFQRSSAVGLWEKLLKQHFGSYKVLRQIGDGGTGRWLSVIATVNLTGGAACWCTETVPPSAMTFLGLCLILDCQLCNFTT